MSVASARRGTPSGGASSSLVTAIGTEGPKVFDEMSLRSEMVIMLQCRRPRSPYRSVQATAKHDLYRAELQGQVAKHEHLYRLNPTLADHVMANGPGHPGTPSQTHPLWRGRPGWFGRLAFYRKTGGSLLVSCQETAGARAHSDELRVVSRH
jgi:hypothetical protein